MSPIKEIKLIPKIHHGEKIIQIAFTYDKLLIEKVKKVEGARWSQSMYSWYIPEKEFDRSSFLEKLNPFAEIKFQGTVTSPASTTNPAPSKITIALPPGYLEKLQQKRYSENTIKIYTSYFRDFVNYFNDRELKEIKGEEINAYLLQLIKKSNISGSQQNQRINAIKFYYEKVLGREKQYYHIERPRKEKRLPDVLSKEEVKAIINATENIKHKSIISIIYSCGLRRSETINIKLEEIDSDRMLVKIRGAKGKKDRYAQLSPQALMLLRKYYKKHTPKLWLFEGQTGGQYSVESVFNVVKAAAKRAGIKKRVYPHILRHSFATHHLEQGTDLRYIQEWLGHESSKTTEIYTHVKNSDFMKFKNPLDDLFEDDS